MASMKRHLSFVILGLLAGVASANQYYVGFEGDCMPETLPGWERHLGGGGANRYIESDPNGNNYLVIDSLASQMIYDFCRMTRQMDPDPGELFIAEWRLAVTQQYGYYDPGVTFAPDGAGTLSFKYYLDHMVSTYEGWSHPIEPVVFHTYRLQSWDMANYQLWIDGELVRNGWWDLGGVNWSFATFGDGTQGGQARSLAKWDYFRFGVVPEPDSVILILLVCVCAAAHRR
jgi:hypothetical protein